MNFLGLSSKAHIPVCFWLTPPEWSKIPILLETTVFKKLYLKLTWFWGLRVHVYVNTHVCLHLSSKSWVGRDLAVPTDSAPCLPAFELFQVGHPMGQRIPEHPLVALLVLNKAGESRYENLLDPGYANPSLGDWVGGWGWGAGWKEA